MPRTLIFAWRRNRPGGFGATVAVAVMLAVLGGLALASFAGERRTASTFAAYEKDVRLSDLAVNTFVPDPSRIAAIAAHTGVESSATFLGLNAYPIRDVATGGSLRDPSIVQALVNPGTSVGDLSPAEEELLRFVAEGRPMKASAASQGTTAEAVADEVEQAERAPGEMNRALLDAGGTVMQFVGDAVMAVFGAPLAQKDHARYATVAATAMHRAQHAVNERWRAQGLSEFGLGIGLSSGRVAAALLGSEERLEYSLVGDAVSLAQRLQQWAEAGRTVLSQATTGALGDGVALERLEQAQVTGWDATVHSYRLVEGGT